MFISAFYGNIPAFGTIAGTALPSLDSSHSEFSTT